MVPQLLFVPDAHIAHTDDGIMSMQPSLQHILFAKRDNSIRLTGLWADVNNHQIDRKGFKSNFLILFLG